MHPSRTNSITEIYPNPSGIETRPGPIERSSIATGGALSVVIISLLLLVARPAFAQAETVLYNFCSLKGTCPDGAAPVSSLTSDGAGNFYGTTLVAGWTYGSYGNVFELSPNGNGGFNETTLHHFTLGADGAYPRSSVIFDNAGNLYGTASGGGYGYGVVFQLSRVGSGWNETTLYTFTNGADGGIPWSSLIMDSAGNLYGTTISGGPGGFGTVFELSSSGGGGWIEKVIYSFDKSTLLEPSGLAMDGNGNIFGAAGFTVFELSPNGNGGWNPNVIYTFPGKYFSIDGTPVIDKEGNIFGTIMREYKKLPSVGRVYKLSRTNNQWAMQTLASWGNNTGPRGGVVLDAAGNVYGTTVAGGSNGYGTVFKLVPQSTRYSKKVLWNFDGIDGATPLGGLILDSAGNLYGTTWAGGTQGFGTAFEVTP
jgi:uncharacterized repeat protein (TIGR03803 family)